MLILVKPVALWLAGKAISRVTPRHTLQIRSTCFLWSLVLYLTCIIARKLPCPWEGCQFRTWQKSNLNTHYRTQYVFFFNKFIKLTCLYMYIIYTAPKKSLTSAPMTLMNVNFELVIQLLFYVTENDSMGIFLDLQLGTRLRNQINTYLQALCVGLRRIHQVLPV
jgi:hypothetical protein